MRKLYQDIIINSEVGKTQLAVLIDPDKADVNRIGKFIEQINQTVATHIFVGGSETNGISIDDLVLEIKDHTELPVILFPGSANQISKYADGILFLSLISGRNADYLIDMQVKAVDQLYNTELEVIPTGYLLIESGNITSVERVSHTKPISRENISLIKDTAKAGEYLGMKLIYLEAGSGALSPINKEIISSVKEFVNLPLIVGGGIKSKEAFDQAIEAGANMVVIGNAFENDPLFYEYLLKPNFKFSSK